MSSYDRLGSKYDRENVKYTERTYDFVDGVTLLEVLEHMSEPALAAREALRVARSFFVASVPSRSVDRVSR